MTHEPEDDRDDERHIPADHFDVKLTIPVPSIEQVGDQMASQMLAMLSHSERTAIQQKARSVMDAVVTRMVTEKATPIIEDLLTKPIQPTDNFGQPCGEPTSLQGVLARRITDWCDDTVDSDGKPKKKDHYNSVATRMSWALGQIVNNELKVAVAKEVKDITDRLRAAATANIAKQIGEQVSKLVLPK